MGRCGGTYASDLDVSADEVHLLLSWVLALMRRTVALSALRVIGLPTDPAFLTLAAYHIRDPSGEQLSLRFVSL
ncbi:MAG: hypothetical protein OJF49_002746 [Ktedonobacterales bacterium]|jgi:hypothetical protein|nr:MAG: hypothetical protein OJF49_002746 [Ktedonobacterales bacterium]